MTDASKTTPRRVLERARELGVHDECIEADYLGACIPCILTFHSVFDEFYGHAESADDAMSMIVLDLLTDLEEEND